ncbi:uncharacterized protein F5891DRAFT_986576 [Suillus fuscotomentosus]|uniref:Uncharacterized protein n=1 Tax=Suillus fuscotomentosus TaxID=1912939 RepID=A0AAD4DRV7_9AGAM|nr:uncharacterized protein F5891DRAFT_986576 [Suillus fuscotomentosus]KAG1891766.1 hypothetical protein F5891DRAFT_986576 [Suillus fuscotomentosus]
MPYMILIRYDQKVNASLVKSYDNFGFAQSNPQALDHEQGHRHSINDYMKLQQYTMNLPDEVFHHHVIMDLAECITDLVLIDNVNQFWDMILYNKEQAAGNKDHNMISIIMLEVGLDISGAMAWAAHYHAEVQK